MSKNVRPIPEGYHSVTPYLVLRKAADAIEFFKKAFGATEVFRMPGPGGAIAHAEIRIGDSQIMMCEENPEMGAQSPQALGGSPANLFLYVDDVEASWERAVEAGAMVFTPVYEAYWGDRVGILRDGNGHLWSLASKIENLSQDEILRRARAGIEIETVPAEALEVPQELLAQGEAVADPTIAA